MSTIHKIWMWTGTRVECAPVDLLRSYEDEEEVLVSDISYLPKNWSRLDWHLVTFAPDVWADDLRIALDENRKIGYCVHDLRCGAFRWEGTLSEFVDKMSMDPPEDNEALDPEEEES